MLTPKHFLQVSVRIIWDLCMALSQRSIYKTDIWLASRSERVGLYLVKYAESDVSHCQETYSEIVTTKFSL